MPAAWCPTRTYSRVVRFDVVPCYFISNFVGKRLLLRSTLAVMPLPVLEVWHHRLHAGYRRLGRRRHHTLGEGNKRGR